MKKLISMILALVMMLSLSVSVMAEDNMTTDDTEKDVTATYTEGTEAIASTIYYVTISWTDVTVAYVGGNGGTYSWDSENLKYVLMDDSKTDGAWTDDGISITVANRSNAAITATASYFPSNNDVKLTFADSGVLNLASAAVSGGVAIEITDTETVGTEVQGTITGTVSGAINTGGTLGRISIVLSHD